MSEEKNENINEFFIPQNYTDSGKVLGGNFNLRNVIEAAAIALLIGFPEVQFLHMETTVKVIIIVTSVLPLGIIALIGIDGESLTQYAGHMIKYFKNKRKLHFRRVGKKKS